jgi:Putative redox-active protein (C_GCAxxG_C_C)
MTKQLSRRNILGQAGLALGGLVTLGALQGCDDDDDGTAPVDTGPTVKDFPYEQHLTADYRLDPAPIREAAYHGYYAGGCCHGAYSALLGHLATTAGRPFDQLPLDFGKFGAGGVAGYGSICGAVLGSVMIINMIVSDATARGNMMTDLMRWYEGEAFPKYLPTALDAAETGTTKDFSAAGIAALQVVPRSHLCHASVSGWCAANGVSASGADKKARCARLTADVAGKAAEIINTYLAGTGSYAVTPIDSASATCLGCHPGSSTSQPVASGMACTSCHTDKASGHP